MTKVSRDPVKLINSTLYRSGQWGEYLSYLDLHQELKKNMFYQVVKGEGNIMTLTPRP